MIEVQKQYKLTLTEDQARQLYDLLRTEKDCGGLGSDGRLSDLRTIHNELRVLFDNGIR